MPPFACPDLNSRTMPHVALQGLEWHPFWLVKQQMLLMPPYNCSHAISPDEPIRTTSLLSLYPLCV